MEREASLAIYSNKRDMMKSKHIGRLLLVKVYITRITGEQGSQLKVRTYSFVAEYINVLNSSEASRTHVKYRS
jgi:hypothetical protein